MVENIVSCYKRPIRNKSVIKQKRPKVEITNKKMLIITLVCINVPSWALQSILNTKITAIERLSGS